MKQLFGKGKLVGPRVSAWLVSARATLPDCPIARLSLVRALSLLSQVEEQPRRHREQPEDHAHRDQHLHAAFAARGGERPVSVDDHVEEDERARYGDAQ